MARNAVLSFGMVNIPVSVESVATKHERKSLKTLHNECKTPVNKPAFCRVCEREVPIHETVSAYEVSRGKYVVLDDKKMIEAKTESSPYVVLTKFAPMEMFPPFIEAVRWLTPMPVDTATRSYWLLHTALKTTSTFGIGKSFLWGKEHPVGLFVDGKGMILTDIYPSQHWQVPSGDPGDVGDDELALACSIIGNMSGVPTLTDFFSEQRSGLDELIAASVAGEEWVAHEAPAVPTATVDLMASLRASVNATKPKKVKA